MATPTPDLIRFTPKERRTPLSLDQLDTLRQATLEILANVGVVFPSETALDIFSDCGASIDRDSRRVRIPADLVARALSTAPHSFVLAGREERFDLHLDGTSTHICTEGVGTRVVDIHTGQVRSSRKDDVAMMARVVDALPLIGFFWPPVSAQDFPSTAPLHECHAGLTNTLKHVRGATTMHPVLARAAVEMATVLAGSAEARRRRPPICANICTVSPLAQDPVGIEAALIYAEAGIPVSFMAMPTAGSTAPASSLGALVQGEAEVVGALVLLQLAYPGCAVMHSNLVSIMDPRTGGYISEVPFHFEPIVSQLAHVAWGVPDLGGAALSSDSSGIDWVSGLRAGMGAALLSSDAADICGYVGGLTAGATVLCPEFIILQHEALMRAHAWFADLHFDRADLALDVIADVGPGGHFLAHRHTRKHLRDSRLWLWQSTVRSESVARPEGVSADRPVDSAPSAAQTAAKAEFLRLTLEHAPEPLPDDLLAELDAILASTDRQVRDLAV
jgi:trimethylamine--corrinoid protein Co-methyltransferase